MPGDREQRKAGRRATQLAKMDKKGNEEVGTRLGGAAGWLGTERCARAERTGARARHAAPRPRPNSAATASATIATAECCTATAIAGANHRRRRRPPPPPPPRSPSPRATNTTRHQHHRRRRPAHHHHRAPHRSTQANFFWRCVNQAANKPRHTQRLSPQVEQELFGAPWPPRTPHTYTRTSHRPLHQPTHPYAVPPTRPAAPP